MNDNKPTITPQIVPSPFKNFCQSIGAIPTSYQDSLDYYETLLWLIKFLDVTVLPAVNTNGEAVAELQNLFVNFTNSMTTDFENFTTNITTLYNQLHDYVEHYFDNLDVQTEINNKLDEMVEDGTLEQIIEQFLGVNSILAFNNLSDLKQAENLTNNSFCATLGYYSANDGGKALYKIRNKTNADVVDDMFIIGLYDEALVGELVTRDDEINVLQLGAKGDNTFDNTTIFTNLLYSNKNNKRIIIPYGKYKTHSWGISGNNPSLQNFELIGIGKPEINLIPSSTHNLIHTYEYDFDVVPGYTKITVGSSVTANNIELADGQKYWYLAFSDNTLIPAGLSNADYLVGANTKIRYNIASIDTNNPDGAGTGRIYLYDINVGNKNSTIFANTSNTLTEDLYVSRYDSNDVWYIDFKTFTVPDAFKTTNRQIYQESTGKNARIKANFTYDSKLYVVIDCFNDEFYNSPFESVTPLDNNSTLKVYTNTGVQGGLCSLSKFEEVKIENIKFNGNNYTIANYQVNQNDWNILYLGGCKNITIRDSIFANAIMSGIHIGGSGNAYSPSIHDYPENVKIDNCYFYNNGRNDLEIIQGVNIIVSNCIGHGSLDIEANGNEILEGINVINCIFNSTTPYKPGATTNLSNVNYTNCKFNKMSAQRGVRINLANTKIHSLHPYQEINIKGVNCLIDKIDTVYGNEHLQFANSVFLGLTNINPGSSYGNSKWYFDNCIIDLSLVKAFKLYDNKLLYLNNCIFTCNSEMTGYDYRSIMHFNNCEINNIKIHGSNNVTRNIFQNCIFTSDSGHHSFTHNVMSGIFKNCYIKTDIISLYGRMTFLDCILGYSEKPVIGGTSRASLIDGIKTDDPEHVVDWDWVYAGGESKLVFKNVWYDVTSESKGLKQGTGAINSSTVSDESFYLYGNNANNYTRGKVVYDGTTVNISKF